MYRRPKFLEVLLKIREEMAREADYDVDFYVEMVRSGIQPATDVRYSIGEPDSGQANGRKATPGKKTKQRPGSTNAD
jgi:hypothetical protein